MGSGEDFELLEAWRGGDRHAGGVLFDRHLTSVSRFFKNKVDGNIEDLVQETFLACVEARDRFEGRSSFRTYLFGVARNILFGHYRTKARTFDPLESSVEGFGVSAGTVIVQSEEQRLLLRALRTLPMEYQITLELYYWEHLKAHELAEVLEISPHTARSRLSRGRTLLKARVEQLAGDPRIGETTIAELEAMAERLDRRRGGD